MSFHADIKHKFEYLYPAQTHARYSYQCVCGVHIHTKTYRWEAAQCREDCNKRKEENKKLVYCTENDKKMRKKRNG